jgi:hypothetical protein
MLRRLGQTPRPLSRHFCLQVRRDELCTPLFADQNLSVVIMMSPSSSVQYKVKPLLSLVFRICDFRMCSKLSVNYLRVGVTRG